MEINRYQGFDNTTFEVTADGQSHFTSNFRFNLKRVERGGETDENGYNNVIFKLK